MVVVNLYETEWWSLTFESVDEILWCGHSNETSSAVLSHCTIYLVCSSNFWVCGRCSLWSPFVKPMNWLQFRCNQTRVPVLWLRFWRETIFLLGWCTSLSCCILVYYVPFPSPFQRRLTLGSFCWSEVVLQHSLATFWSSAWKSPPDLLCRLPRRLLSPWTHYRSL